MRTWELSAVVFMTGAAVLVMEVSATRILSPYFGNTIYSLSSVLSVILAALSAGYYHGGRLADRRPEHGTFYSIIVLGGLAVLVMRFLSVFALPFIGLMSLTWGPLVASLLLFFAPAYLLGLLSPFAVKLQSLAREGQGVGSVSGTIFFWSTLGSIAGSLLTGFVLVPRLGLQTLTISLSAFLVALGLAGKLLHRKLAKRDLVRAGAALAIGIYLAAAGDMLLSSQLIFAKDGVYERLSVQDILWEGKPTRFFLQDRSSSGAMSLGSGGLVFDYTKYYELYRLTKPEPARALFIGGGAYSMPKELLKAEPGAMIEVAEIEPSLPGLAEKYFALPRDPRLSHRIGDGRRILREADDGTYDLIFSDVYNSLYSIPSHFTTREFFELAKAKLSDRGVFLANIAGRLDRSGRSFLLSEIRTFREAFPASYVFATKSPDSDAVQNFVFMGVRADAYAPLESLAADEAGRALAARYEGKLVDVGSLVLDESPLLTDDYAPVEYLNSGALARRDTDASDAFIVPAFDGKTALSHVAALVGEGSRSLRSPGHAAAVEYIESAMKQAGVPAYRQTWERTAADGERDTLTNVVARVNEGARRRIIVASHYDTRRFADRDPKDPKAYMPGANDGSSGVAVMLELGRSLAKRGALENVGVDLVFFDGEEGEEDPRAVWQPLGSEHFAKNLRDFYEGELPSAGIVIDMVCDRDLAIYRDGESQRLAPGLNDRFFEAAAKARPDAFRDSVKHFIIDDHQPLNAAGIPSILLIDFDYPYFHTTADTPDKCSAKSLSAVGTALSSFIFAEDAGPR